MKSRWGLSLPLKDENLEDEEEDDKEEEEKGRKVPAAKKQVGRRERKEQASRVSVSQL
jgi:hypothetical protein